MANRLPELSRRHKICLICEGYEDIAYIKRLQNLEVWSDTYVFTLINAKGASNISARFQDAFQNDRYELVLVFCDTDKAPYREYAQVKEKLNCFLNKPIAAQALIIFANPCTMQIILSHFGDVSLKNQGKGTNSAEIEKWTGVKNYNAHEDQIEAICNKIFRRNYADMRRRVAVIDFSDTVSCSTNFSSFLDHFESDDAEWIAGIQEQLKE